MGFCHVGAVLVHEAVQKIEVENFPGHDVANSGNQGDGDSDGKRFGKCDLAVANVVAVFS